uniref:Sushi domain-containing protein n=1 Tax=Zosterops lateralis melanops TaxID=1220523 RepID=A0A8D2QLL6_ZOSLA
CCPPGFPLGSPWERGRLCVPCSVPRAVLRLCVLSPALCPLLCPQGSAQALCPVPSSVSPALSPGRCRSPPSVEFAELRRHFQPHGFPPGSRVSYSCRLGYALIPGVTPTITCLQNYTWSPLPRLCQPGGLPV